MIDHNADERKEFHTSLENVSALATLQTVPTGILHTSPFTFYSVENYDGESRSEVITQRLWEQHYHDLQRKELDESKDLQARPELAHLQERANVYTMQGITPIAIANLVYNRPGSKLVTEARLAHRHNRPMQLPAQPELLLEERRAFLASSLLPDRFDNFVLLPPVHFGPSVRFLIDSAFYATNDPEPIQSIEVDFADGQGYRQVPQGEPISVEYADTAEKQIQILVHYADRTLKAGFVFQMKSMLGIPRPDDTWKVQATIPYQGSTGTGTAYVLYGSTQGAKHTRLVQPIMVADGFPGNPYELIYELLDAQGFVSSVLASGYDIVILTYDNGTDYIQRNAFVAAACIDKINAQGLRKQKVIVGGASMGGVIARYALAYMQHNGIDPNTKIFLSFDAPHGGAIIPPSVQFYVNALAQEGNTTAQTMRTLLLSNAARQMLIYSVDFANRKLVVDPLSTAFYKEYRNLTQLGYPLGVTKIAVANGAGDSVKVVPDLAQTLKFEGFCFSGSANALPTGSGKIAFLAPGFSTYNFSVTGAINYDGAPGGQSPANGALAQALAQAGYEGQHWYDYTCFVPTISALDIDTSNPYTTVHKADPAVPFDRFFVSSYNSRHVTITRGINQFLLRQLDITIVAGLVIGPVVVENTRSYVFIQGSNSNLWICWWTGTQWQWTDQGKPRDTAIAAAVGVTTLRGVYPYAFMLGENGHVWVNWWTATEWRWDDLNMPPTTSIAAAVGATIIQGHAHSFMIGADGNLWVCWWTSAVWQWDNRGTPATTRVTGKVGVAAVNDQLPYVFVRGENGHLCVYWWTARGWRWDDLNMPPTTSIAASVGATIVQGRAYAFVIGGDGNLWVCRWTGAVWQWDNQGQPASTTIAETVGVTVVDNGSRPYVFVRGEDGHLWSNWWTGNRWFWSDHGTPSNTTIVAGVGAVTVSNTSPYIFMRSDDDHLWINWWDGANWHWSDLE